jgi:hypothetical protein
MSVDRTAPPVGNGPVLDTPHAGSRRARLARSTVIVGSLVVGAIPMATVADAHVKWFVTCNVADEPLPLTAVFTPAFWLLSALFVTSFSLACAAEQTAFGAILARRLDRWSEPLHRRADEFLRAAAAIAFALLWADGGVILTPELKATGMWLSAIQALIPIYLFGRATLPAAGAGILVLYGYAVAAYGAFHMLDYPVYLGLAAYFVLSASSNAKHHAMRSDLLRWTVALSLLWPSMEKFVYPGWIAPIAVAHPELTLGIDVATFITAAGVVEFGLAFALLWTPLVRRLAALTLALMLVAATFDFGKVDGIGHLLIIAALLVVFADPGRDLARCRPVLAPLTSGTSMLAAIFIYIGAHALYYGSWRTALVPLLTGAALLAIISLYLHGRVHGLVSFVARRSRRLLRDMSGDARCEAGDALTIQAR